MDIKKIGVLVVLAIFLATPAFGWNSPEYDAVGTDNANIFAVDNDLQCGQLDGATTATGALLEANSAFPVTPDLYGEAFAYQGIAISDGSPYLVPDLCFNRAADEGYMSVRTTKRTQAEYQWWIVLQMQPESDINLSITDCVGKPQFLRPRHVFRKAQQTGLYRESDFGFQFDPFRNPRVTVVAYPGPLSNFTPFTMCARTMPDLNPTFLGGALYTSKSFWDESIVIALPNLGQVSCGGDSMQADLRQGDQLKVIVDIPSSSVVDLYYGPDNVMLKYIGEVGTELVSFAAP